MDPETTPPQSLEELVAACLDGIERRGSAALEEMCLAHPEQAAALRSRVAALHKMGFIEVGASPAAFPERLGAFRLIRMLGGGGMGVVYLAEQEGLGRTVALKLIRPEHLYFPGARERFAREVEAVARLRHPGIVPVYTVGEEAGVPYFAMEHVEGKTLAQCLESLRGRNAETLTSDDLAKVVGARGASASASRASSSAWGSVLRGRWVETCLRLIRDVALALQHAHERGVLHRDVKPSNVMLTPEGRVMLLDFGLAISQDATRLTQSGTMLGSKPYMSPEQVRGKVDEIGPATDVYGLGVMLYEMLVMRLPYPAELATELEQAIIDGDPDPPSRLNRTVPWDAETVCLTAFDPDPRRRYASAEAFARDLSNVLELRPIEARRLGAGLRAQRFVQRRPATSVAIALGALVAIGGPLVYGALERSRRLEVTALNSKLEEALAETTLQRERAQESFQSALQAVDLMLSEVGGRELDDVPLMEGVRRRLLERALAFYRSFQEDHGEDEDVLRRVADGHDRVGQILVLLGRNEEAAGQLVEAVRRHAELGKAADSPAVREDQARKAVAARLALAELRIAGGDLAEAEREVADAQRVLEERLAAQPTDEAAAAELAQVLQLRSQVAAGRGDLVAAEARLHEALGLGAAGGVEAAGRWCDLGLLLMRDAKSYPDRADEIEEAFTRSLEVFDALPADDQRKPEARTLRATTLNNLAGHYRRLDRFEEAEVRYAEALAVLEELTAAYPERVASRRELAHVLNNLGLVAELTNRTAESEARYQQAVDRLEALHRAMPGVAELAANLGIGWMNLAIGAQRRGDRALEAERLEQALGYLREARKLQPAEPRWRVDVFNVLGGLVAARLALGRYREAAAAAVEAQATIPDQVKHSMRAAIYLGRSTAVALVDETISDEEKEALRLDYAAKAVGFLRNALELGLEDPEKIAALPDFAPFVGTPEFDALTAEVAKSEG